MSEKTEKKLIILAEFVDTTIYFNEESGSKPLEVIEGMPRTAYPRVKTIEEIGLVLSADNRKEKKITNPINVKTIYDKYKGSVIDNAKDGSIPTIVIETTSVRKYNEKLYLYSGYKQLQELAGIIEDAINAGATNTDYYIRIFDEGCDNALTVLKNKYQEERIQLKNLKKENFK